MGSLRIDILLHHEDVGFSASVLQLPGAVGQGNTAMAAVENALEGLCEILAGFRESGKPVPWVGRKLRRLETRTKEAS